MSKQERFQNAQGVKDRSKNAKRLDHESHVLESPYPASRSSIKFSNHPSSNSHGSFKKLLNSHSSIYNALNNPDLDVSPNLGCQNSPRFTPDLDPSFSITSWQSLSNESFDPPRAQSVNSYRSSRFQTPSPAPIRKSEINKPASILSITTDEDAKESMVIVQSPKTPSNVMVFETDEEDMDDLEELKNPSSFIMPRMSLSDTPNTTSQPKMNVNSNFVITIISSCPSPDVTTLVQLLDLGLENKQIQLRQLVIEEGESRSPPRLTQKQYKNLKKSNLVFIINDGSKSLVDILGLYLKKAGWDDEECYTSLKLTIINVMTFNYFITLFDLINSVRPHQIWKTSSLKNERLLKKVSEFIKVEFTHSEIFSGRFNQLSRKNRELSQQLASFDVTRSKSRSNSNSLGGKLDALDFAGVKIEIPETKRDFMYCPNDNTCNFKSLNIETSKSLNPSTSVYTDLIPTKKPDYKTIEKKIKSDLETSYQFNDPLKISNSNIKLCYSIMKKIMSSKDHAFVIEGSNKHLWFLLSFSLGIGLGIGFTSMAETVFNFGVDSFRSLKNVVEYLIAQCSTDSIGCSSEIFANTANFDKDNHSVTNYTYGQSETLYDMAMSSIDVIKSSKVVGDVVHCFRDITRGLLLTGSMAIEGFDKLVGLVFG